MIDTDQAPRTVLFLRVQEVADWLESKGLDVSPAWKRRDRREPGRKRKEEYEDKIYAFFMRYWRKQKKDIREQLQGQYPDRKSLKAVPSTPSDEDIAALIRILTAAIEDGIELFDEQINLIIDYTLVNAEAAEWAREYAYNLIGGIDNTTQRVLQTKVRAFVETPGMTLRDIMDALPYTEKRALKIATTEVTRVYAEGNQRAGEQLQREFPEVRVVKEWFTNRDDRVCTEICEPLDGKTVGIGEEFASDIKNPPAHVLCRCWTGQTTELVEREEEEAEPEFVPAAEVRQQVAAVAAQHQSEIAAHQQRLDELSKQLKQASNSKDWDLWDRLFNERVEVVRTQRELRLRSREATLPLLYVDNPSMVTLKQITRFDAQRREAITEGGNIFQRLVGTETLDDIAVEFRGGGRGRSHMEPNGNIRLTTGAEQRAVLHELGHSLEHHDPEVHRKALEFYQQRTAGESPKWLGDHYGRGEKTREDKFIDPYMGKDYKGKYTEIVSMGVEYMYEDAPRLAREDPEYFDFMYNLLRGK